MFFEMYMYVSVNFVMHSKQVHVALTKSLTILNFLSSAIAGREINVTLVITSLSCVDGKYNQSLMLSKKLNETVKFAFY